MTEARLRIPDDLILTEAWQQLEGVLDPELGVNLVDLGLVYKLEADSGEVQVEMTLTTPGCPMSDSMPEAVERSLMMIPGVHKVLVDLVWEPRWEPEMMSDRAKEAIGWI
ncbi:MAG TPA: iron-sulfur cluster assembly protein [Candidatus Acidoferrales bacterium]|nr:iron-sulfur cluster assembly protein [Candidatus Acidoferrales bacterium]